MKDSGLQWVGKIPEIWEMSKVKLHMQLSSAQNPGGATILSLYREYGVIPKDSRDDNHNVTSKDTSKYKYVRVGDFAINKMKAWQGSLAVSEFEGVVSPAYYVYRFSGREIVRKFFHYLIRSQTYAQEFRRLSTGIREGQWDLASQDFERTKIPFPPLPEQEAIATFLDSVTGKIDELRGKLKREIDRLEDYKKSAITKAVCHGLDPRAKMKDSGIPWVGKVPEGWKEQRISKLYLVRSEKVSDKEHQPLTVGKMGVVPQLEHVAKTNDGDNRKHVCPGDFVINSRSDRRGACGISSLDGSVSLINIVLRPREEMDNSYFNWVFHTEEFADEFYKWGKGIDADVWTTRWMMMKKIIVPFPPLPEQREIAAHIDTMVGRVNAIVEKRKRQLDALDKLKRTVVYDYVTGKREVPLSKGGRSR